MNFKAFFRFFYAFLGIICVVTIPTLIHEKNYKNLLIFSLILCFLLVISISLYVFFTSMATSYHIEKDEVILRYETSSKRLTISKIGRITISDYRYIIHLKSGEKFYVSRILGRFKLQKNIDPQMLDLSNKYGINLIKK